MANIPSDLQYITHINECWFRDYVGGQTFKNLIGQTSFCSGSRDWLYTPTYDTNICSFIVNSGGYWHDETKEMQLPLAMDLNLSPTTIRIDVDTQSEETVNVTYSNINVEYLYNLFTCPNGYYGGNGRLIRFQFNMSYDPTLWFTTAMDDRVLNWQRATFSILNDAIEYIYTHYANIDLYVDGENWVKASPTTYGWQSVPSISGKNGILSLVTLDSESINDGEPVSGAAVSVFDQAPSDDNNIKNLADTYGGGEESSTVDVTVKYKVTLPPGGSFSVLKLVAKKDSIPEDVSDGDKIVDISPSKTKKTVTGLDENSLYYFKIFGEDTNSNTSESDEKHITTSADEGWNYDYTGEIQTFVAPKTGIYQLETWGAQGGDATDGTNSARGGYGAYAVGEVFLTQGDTLYINVGGQNGYGGGGGFNPYRQVNSWEAGDGNTYDCLKINDYSIIPQSIKDSATMTYSKLTNGGSLPSYIEEQGDLIHTSVYSDIANNIQINYCDNEKLKITLGKYYSTETSSRPFYGVGFYDVRVSTSSSFCGEGWIDSGSTAIASYIGVVLDISEHRGYIIWDAYLTNHPSRNGHNIYVVGGKSNGVDIIWETFKNG